MAVSKGYATNQKYTIRHVLWGYALCDISMDVLKQIIFRFDVPKSKQTSSVLLKDLQKQIDLDHLREKQSVVFFCDPCMNTSIPCVMVS